MNYKVVFAMVLLITQFDYAAPALLSVVLPLLFLIQQTEEGSIALKIAVAPLAS